MSFISFQKYQGGILQKVKKLNLQDFVLIIINYVLYLNKKHTKELKIKTCLLFWLEFPSYLLVFLLLFGARPVFRNIGAAGLFLELDSELMTETGKRIIILSNITQMYFNLSSETTIQEFN